MTEGNEISRRSFLSRSAMAGGVVALGAGAPTLLGGCSSSSGSPTTTSGSKAGIGAGHPQTGGHLTVGTIAEIDGFYPPTNHWDTNGFLYANTVYDPLMAIAADGSVQPYLCQSMTPNSSYDTWTMTLRPNVKFSDGSALTSAVVAANYHALRTSILAGPALTQITNVTTPDAMTIVYSLQAPNPTFPAGLTSQLGYVVGQAMIDQANSGTGGVLKPVGTGPFVYSQWQQNSFFTATRNPNYWRSGLPYLDTITFRPIPDSTQREATLRSGGVDMIESATPATITNFEGQSGWQLVDTRTQYVGEPTLTYIMVNCVVPPTNDLSIRQALAKGMNQSALQKVIGGPPQQPATGVFLPGSPYYSKSTYPTFDPSGATSLVNEYKAKHGTPAFTLMTIPDPIAIKEVQALQQMWNQVGFNVSLKEVEQATIISDFVTGNFQAVTSYQFGSVTPDLNYVWWSNTTISPVGSIGLNFTRFNDPQLEAAMLQGRHTADQATRVAAYQKVSERLNTDLPYLWIEQLLFSEVAAARVQNFNGPTLPSGKPRYGFYPEGVFSPTEVWLNG